MKKRLISIMMSLIMLVSLAGITASAEEDNAPTVMVDDRVINFADQKPVILENEGRTLVPARGVFECMGARVDWDGDKSLVTINSSDNITRILITINDPEMLVYTFTSLFTADENKIMLDAAPRIMNDRTMIPLRAISEALNTTVKWDEKTRTVSIFTKDYEGDIEATPTASSDPSATADPSSTTNPASTAAPSASSDPSATADPSATSAPDNSNTSIKNDNPEISISASKTTAAVGDVIDVYVNIKGISSRLKDNEGIGGVTFGLKYDSDILEYVNGSIKYNAKENIFNDINSKFAVNKLKAIGITTEFDNISKADGEVARISFKVKSAGSASIKLSTDIDTAVGADTRIDIVNSNDDTSRLKDLKINTNEIRIN